MIQVLLIDRQGSEAEIARFLPSGQNRSVSGLIASFRETETTLEVVINPAEVPDDCKVKVQMPLVREVKS